jgi:DNA-binding IclR family transcriptional regulator
MAKTSIETSRPAPRVAGGDKAPQGVDAALVVGVILDALTRSSRPARLRDLEMAAGIPAAKLHRYLVSLVHCGLVRRQPHGNRYDFGLLAYRIGQVAAHNDSVITLLEPALADLANELGRAVGVGQWLGYGATVVRWFEPGSAPLSMRLRPGVDLTLTGSATAMLLAAHQPREVTEPLVRTELQDRGVSGDPAIEKVYRDYARIRQRGIASSLGARRHGLNALSVPLSDHRGDVILALTVVGMAPDFDASTGGHIALRLLAVGAELSMQLGRSE